MITPAQTAWANAQLGHTITRNGKPYTMTKWSPGIKEAGCFFRVTPAGWIPPPMTSVVAHVYRPFPRRLQQ